MLVLACVLLGATNALTHAQSASESPNRRTVTAVRLTDGERIALDGRLDEPVWSRAVPATDFIQQDPANGASATERTEVRFALTRDALYMGVQNFDSEPDKLAANTMKRDEFLRADDRFMWVIDPFLNAQGGYFFEMNPAGSMADSLMGPTGATSREWDGIWDARVIRSDRGWTIEIEIPFRTLNFDPNGKAWGINFLRSIRRKNEDSLWMGWGYNQGLFRIQNTGLLLGISDVTQGMGLDIRPYGLATAAASPGRGQSSTKTDADAGIDLYYSVTPALRANLTVNTDFAQTEVDQRLVNLTQFPLFFAEKRGFFLEGASFFDFVSSTQGSFGGGRGNDTAVVPFFSRRIGLGEGGIPQKIDAGAKLTGQVGAHDVGFLQIRTAGDGSLLGEDFTVARLKRRMLRQSYVGLLYTRRSTRESELEKRTTLGVDYRFGTATFLGEQNLETTGYFLNTTNPLNTGKSSAFGLAIDYPNDLYSAGLSYREIQDNYNPAVGFTLRDGYRRYGTYLRFQPRPRNSAVVRQYTFGIDGEMQLDTKENAFLLRKWDVTLFRASLQSQDNIDLRYLPTYERLDRLFAISRGIVLPIGARYMFHRFRANASTSNNRVLAVSATAEVGGFYSGDRQLYSLNFSIRPRRGVVVYLDTEWNNVQLAEGTFTTRLYRAVSDTQFSPWLALTNNIQFDSVSSVMGWQSRFRWIVRPGNDFFFVYNHNWLDDPILDRFATLDRRAATKIQFTRRF
jgi:hypothetical protein